jgi:hypothetical protein
VRKQYERLGRERSERFRELFASMGVDRIEAVPRALRLDGG